MIPSQNLEHIQRVAHTLTLRQRYDVGGEPSKRTIALLTFVGFCAYSLGLPALVLWLSDDWRWRGLRSFEPQIVVKEFRCLRSQR